MGEYPDGHREGRGMDKEGFVYILQSTNNGSYYIGSTKDLSKRILYHNAGYCKATKFLVPYQLLFSQKFDSLLDARKIEYKLKRFKNRKIIEKIIHDKQIKMGP